MYIDIDIDINVHTLVYVYYSHFIDIKNEVLRDNIKKGEKGEGEGEEEEERC